MEGINQVPQADAAAALKAAGGALREVCARLEAAVSAQAAAAAVEDYDGAKAAKATAEGVRGEGAAWSAAAEPRWRPPETDAKMAGMMVSLQAMLILTVCADRGTAIRGLRKTTDRPDGKRERSTNGIG